MCALPLADVTRALERLAPLACAEPWDNVGLLLEVPDAPPIARVLLTIDLTEEVLDEAIGSSTDLIVAYHPPIFDKLVRLTTADPKQRIVLRAVRAGISIYSPHTALDAATGGVNDWLCDAFHAGGDNLREGFPQRDDGVAIARRLRLAQPIDIEACIARIKRHLDLVHVRAAISAAHRGGGAVQTIALCAGAGGSLLAGQPADLYWTGEMRHHDVLAALERGTSVVLCDHTNTERGYLPILRSRLATACPGVAFALASHDEEPLQFA